MAISMQGKMRGESRWSAWGVAFFYRVSGKAPTGRAHLSKNLNEVTGTWSCKYLEEKHSRQRACQTSEGDLGVRGKGAGLL